MDPKTLNRKANPHYQALFRMIDKYAKKVPAQEFLDAELKAWKVQKGTSGEQATESEDLS